MATKKKYATKKKTSKKSTIKAGTIQKASLKPKQKVTVEIDAAPVKPKGKKKSSLDAKRFEAGVVYITTIDSISIEDLHKDPRFADISIVTLGKWSAQDKWRERRQQLFLGVQKKLEAKLADQLEVALLQEIEDLMEIRSMAMGMVKKELTNGVSVIPAKSWEGLAKVIMQANQRLDDIRHAQARSVVDAMGDSDGQSVSDRHPAAKISYTKKELRDASNYILAQRRADRKEAKEATGLSEEEAQKALKLVGGNG